MKVEIEKKHFTNKDLFDRQMQMLKEFLESGAITKQQYDTSANTLIQKTGFSIQ